MTDIPTITQEEAVEVRALKPCPFCGGEVETFGPYGWYRHWGISHSCTTFYNGSSEVCQGFATEALAIAAWNARAALSPNMDHAVGGDAPATPIIAICSARPRAQTQSNRGHQWWARDVWHIQSAPGRSLCGRDAADWLVIGEMATPDANCCKACADRQFATPPVNQDAVLEADEEPCSDGSHCCCCGPGEKCCDCGAVMPIPQEIDALRRALADLTRACEEADALEDLPMGIDGSLLDAANEALEMQYPVIWSDEDVAKLQAHQDESKNHPYTCGGDRSDAAHRAQAEEDGNDAGTLVPTKSGWRCLSCEYRQFWAHGVTNALATPPLDNTGLDAATVERCAGECDMEEARATACIGQLAGASMAAETARTLGKTLRALASRDRS